MGEKLYEVLKSVLLILIFLTGMSRNVTTAIVMGAATTIVFVMVAILENNLRKRGYFSA